MSDLTRQEAQYVAQENVSNLTQSRPPRVLNVHKPRRRKFFEPEALISMADLARVTGLSHDAIRFWVARGWIPAPCAKVGGRKFFTGEQINGWESKLAWKYLR